MAVEQHNSGNQEDLIVGELYQISQHPVLVFVGAMVSEDVVYEVGDLVVLLEVLEPPVPPSCWAPSLNRGYKFLHQRLSRVDVLTGAKMDLMHNFRRMTTNT